MLKPSVSVTPSRLLERASQVAALNEHLAAVIGSTRGRLVFLGGEAGDSKPALLGQICAQHACSVRILSGTCDALFTRPRQRSSCRVRLKIGTLQP